MMRTTCPISPVQYSREGGPPADFRFPFGYARTTCPTSVGQLSSLQLEVDSFVLSSAEAEWPLLYNPTTTRVPRTVSQSLSASRSRRFITQWRDTGVLSSAKGASSTLPLRTGRSESSFTCVLAAKQWANCASLSFTCASYYPFEVIHLDHIGPLTTDAHGNKFI
jgi:hypothetical protein